MTNPIDEPVPATKAKVSRTQSAGVWIGLIAMTAFGVVLVVFVAQNSRKAPIHFLGWHGRFPIAFTILVAAVIGMVLVAIPCSIRLFQLRRALRKTVRAKS